MWLYEMGCRIATRGESASLDRAESPIWRSANPWRTWNPDNLELLLQRLDDGVMTESPGAPGSLGAADRHSLAEIRSLGDRIAQSIATRRGNALLAPADP